MLSSLSLNAKAIGPIGSNGMARLSTQQKPSKMVVPQSVFAVRMVWSWP
jgi:hypothetical protein